jgi:hypothetical protein
MVEFCLFFLFIPEECFVDGKVYNRIRHSL